MAHAHKSIDSHDKAWGYCVASHKKHSERVHGNITRVETCACGAERHTEINAGASISTGWASDASDD